MSRLITSCRDFAPVFGHDGSFFLLSGLIRGEETAARSTVKITGALRGLEIFLGVNQENSEDMRRVESDKQRIFGTDGRSVIAAGSAGAG
jgi:hypothetical protein